MIGAGGEVELVFEYDSDWSDLADDEEPDSNDERYDGNDYPEVRVWPAWTCAARVEGHSHPGTPIPLPMAHQVRWPAWTCARLP